ncbi:cytochrome P450 4V2 [Exaiptasia diaphana]|uniref:Cytochrome P450 n=1 Tax=Exaiptasia diaphana TaxID=2652724 RepID=A0A913YED0_EXADI|nr:cytochrome P450 4V2 [Exaiptasia diaphana]
MESTTESSAWIAVAVFSSCSFLVICYVTVLFRKKLQSLKSLSQCPGPKPVLLFGNALQFKRDNAEFYDQIMQWSKENWSKGMFCMWFGPFHSMVVIFKPELVETILSSNRQITKSLEYNLLEPWLGTGLLLR